MKKLIVVLSLMALLGLVPLAAAQDGVETLCLVTDIGRVNDGTFNQFAHSGALEAADDYDLEYKFIETQAETDYDANIQTCIDEGFEVIVTVGFLIADSTRAAAEANPDVYFLGVDQFVMGGPTNYVGIQFREDQSGFLAGVLAAQVAGSVGSDTIAGIYGIDIPPVKKFRNGFEQGRATSMPISTCWVYTSTVSSRRIAAHRRLSNSSAKARRSSSARGDQPARAASWRAPSKAYTSSASTRTNG